MKRAIIKLLRVTAPLYGIAGLSLSLLPAQCQSPGPSETPQQAVTQMQAGPGQGKENSSALSLDFGRHGPDSNGDLTLSDLRDSGLSLNQIRQQAINIFLEATRCKCENANSSDIHIPTAISEKDIQADARKAEFLEPRAQWLVYYIGTVEPIISLFTQDVHDTEIGATKLLVPKDAREKIRPLWHEWAEGISGINKELTEINNLIGDGKQENAALAKHAVAMFNFTESLERTRQKAFAAIAHSEKRHGNSDKVNLP